MLRHIQALDLLFRTRAKADRSPDELKDQDHTQDRIASDGKDAETLHAKLPQPAAIKKAFGAVALITGKQAYGDRAPDPVDAVDRHRADRIVHVETHVQDLHRQIHEDPRDNANNRCSERIHAGAASGDGDQSGQRGVEAHGDIRLSVLPPGKEHTGDRCHRRGDRSCPEDTCHLFHIGCRRAVKAVPGKPQNKNTQSAQGYGVSRDRI